VSENVTDQSKSRPIRCVVVSSKMNKSRTAVVERLVKHEQYGKYRRRRTKLMFHDEQNVSQEGDHVLVRAARPLSHRKRFELIEVVRQAQVTV